MKPLHSPRRGTGTEFTARMCPNIREEKRGRKGLEGEWLQGIPAGRCRVHPSPEDAQGHRSQTQHGGNGNSLSEGIASRPSAQALFALCNSNWNKAKLQERSGCDGQTDQHPPPPDPHSLHKGLLHRNFLLTESKIHIFPF